MANYSSKPEDISFEDQYSVDTPKENETHLKENETHFRLRSCYKKCIFFRV